MNFKDLVFIFSLNFYLGQIIVPVMQIYSRMVTLASVTSDSETPWTVARQVPRSMRFSRQEYWSGLPFPFAGDLPDPGAEPGSPAFQVDSIPAETPGKLYLGLGKSYSLGLEDGAGRDRGWRAP